MIAADSVCRDHPLRAYTSEEAAVILGCEPGWLEELARQRKVRYTELSGTCHFTNAHLAAITLKFEVAPADEPSETAASLAPAELAHDADRAAALIGGTCKASWLKQQARDGVIPYVKLGGAYNFTDADLAEIMTIFGVGPRTQSASQPTARPPVPVVTAPGGQGVPLLESRTPRTRRGRPADDDDPGIT